MIRITSILVVAAIFLCGCAHSSHNEPQSNGTNVGPESPVCERPSAGQGDNGQSDSFTSEEGLLVYATPTNGNEEWDEDSNGDPSALKMNQAILDKALDFCQASQDFWQKGEFENAIEALDQAYALIQEVDTEASPKLIQGKDDLRFMISKRILEIYASRNIVVNGNYNAIPVTINKHVQNEINLFTTGKEKEFFLQSYQRSGMYRAQIAEAFKEAGLPVELSWLPLIESGFKVKALSRARALGLWQFIPSTGYKYGLKRDMFIDERMDPEKSTQAAIAYLKELHNMFGDWATVLAAYNCGEGRVLRVIRSQNVNYLDNFWDLYERLPRETARYVPRFLATLQIMNNLDTYGLESVCVDAPLVYEKITVDKQVKLSDVAKSIGRSDKLLDQLNPELRYKIVPPGPYALKVPPRTGETVLAKLDGIPLSSPPRPAYVYHRVRSGESLSTIAKKYRTSTSSIARANNLSNKHYIVAGKILKIPQQGGATSTVQSSTAKYTGPRPETYVVVRGDSLWIIANRFGTTTKELQALNNLSSAMLSVGQVLKIPGGGEVALAKGLKEYQVKRGDSPSKIAQHHNMSVNRLLSLNNLSTGSTIYPGQVLVVE